MANKVYQKTFTRLEAITKATVSLKAPGVSNDELAVVDGRLAQVVKTKGDLVTLQVFSGTEGIPNNAEVVFQTIGLVSSLRANCKYGEGDEETIYFGGQDTTYLPWLKYRMANPNDSSVLPIVIRYLDPETAGTDNEDWSGIIADFL